MANPTMRGSGYTGAQLAALSALRMLIGWHLLYEGITKILNPYWTSAGYLADSQWIFSGIFQRIAANPSLLAVADGVTKWGLVVIGATLLVGLAGRWAAVAGGALVLLFYLCAPPMRGLTYSMPTEGSYLIVNKTLIETVALFVLWLFPTSHITGLDALLSRRGEATATAGTDARHAATA